MEITTFRLVVRMSDVVGPGPRDIDTAASRPRASGWRAPFALLLWSLVVVASASACRSRDQVLTEQRKMLTSVRATIAAVGDAWLSGNVSSTFARTTLERTLQLLETNRSQLVASPQLLADSRFADLTQSADRLTRAVGLLWKSVDDDDTGEVRRQLADIRSPHHDQP